MKQSNKCACARVRAGIFAAARLLKLCGSRQPSILRGASNHTSRERYPALNLPLIVILLLLASATAAAQKNQLSIEGVGNFNPITYIYLNSQAGDPAVGSSQKSSLGGGLEYDHWFTRYQAFGLRYEQNPSDGKLLGEYERWYIWPQMRYEFIGMFTQQLKVNTEQLKINRFAPFIQEGAGAVVTHEYGDGNAAGAGWSHSLAFAAGGGENYWVNSKFAVRFSAIILADQTGCYDDPTCRPTWGVSHDFGAGFSWKW